MMIITIPTMSIVTGSGCFLISAGGNVATGVASGRRRPDLAAVGWPAGEGQSVQLQAVDPVSNCCVKLAVPVQCPAVCDQCSKVGRMYRWWCAYG